MELVRNTHMDMLHNISKSMKDIRSITNKNVRRASTIDPSDDIYLLASHESYKPTSERGKELQTYTYQEELSNDIVAVYTMQDSAIVAFRGTASVEEATSTWGFLAQSEAAYVGTDHHKNIRQHSDEVLQQLEEQGIQFSEITFTGHSKGGTDAIIAESHTPGSRAVVFNAAQGIVSSIDDEAEKNVKFYSKGGDVASFSGVGRYGDNIILPPGTDQ